MRLLIPHKCRSSAGFTLVELVVVIVLAGILATLGGMFISRPIEGYIDLARRAELVDQADMALRRMQRDVRAALPNSIRVFDGGQGLELLHVVDGGRYRRRVDPAASPPDKQDNVLKFNQPDDLFEVLGGLQHEAEIDTGNDQVVIYNLAATGITANAYHGDNRAVLGTATTAAVITLNAAKQFPLSSPAQRFYIIDEAISYLVENGELRRYSGYPLDNVPGPPGNADFALVSRYATLTDADGNGIVPFAYNPGTASRSGMVTLNLALQNAGEYIHLLHQVHADNAP